MPRYRKKPVEIDAFQFTGDHVAVEDWAASLVASGRAKRMPDRSTGAIFWGDHRGVIIRTLEGEMIASLGDWIICGVQGEFYPCKPDIFAATYDPVGGA